MIIEHTRLTRIRVPLKGTFVSSQNLRKELLRTVIRIRTDTGLEGIGECPGTPEVFALAKRLAGSLLGRDAFDRASIRTTYGNRLFQNMNGRNGWIAMGGVEMALWDLAGKAMNRPVYDLLGGRWRDRVPAVCEMGAGGFLPPEATADDVHAFFADRANIDQVVACAVDRHRLEGYGTIKIKSIARDPGWDVAVMQGVRDALGPGVQLRHDPNAAYDLETATTLCQQLDSLGLDWFEDPTVGLEGLSRLRVRLRTPVATNMFVIQLDQLVPAVRLGAVDVVGADPFHWGGLAAVRELHAACDALGLEVFLHSMFELSVATAANLHAAVSLPNMNRGFDTCLYIQEADIVDGGPLKIVDGHVAVPEGLGLGIALDETAINGFALESFESGT